MSIYFTKRLCFLGFFLVTIGHFAQTDFELLHEPEFSINHEFSNNYKANFGIAARHFVYKDNEFYFKNRQLQVSHFSTLSIAYNKSVSFGIMFRNRDWFDEKASNEIRLTQQFNYTKRKNVIRFGHRFRSEQRVLNTTTYRLRYRFALDSPLQGEKLDIGESYFVTNTELLLSLNKFESSRLDNRITAQLGWKTSEDLKFQVGLQYRFENFNQDLQQILLLLTSVVLKI